MKIFRKIPAIHVSLLVFLLLIPGPGQSAAPSPDNDTAAVNAFAVDLYQQIREPEGNLIFSPYSISMCLAMAYAGARGNTESQMAKALHIGLGQAKTAQAFSALNAQVLTAGRANGIELNVANALWGEKSFEFRKEYLESVRMNYASAGGWPSRIPLVGRLVEFVSFVPQEGLRQADFKGTPESARNTINKWVEDQTRSKIKDLFPSGSINNGTRLVLSNAIYFTGFWEHQFPRELTKPESFYLLSGKDIKIPIMRCAAAFGYMEEADFQALEMPYKGGELSMIVLLPRNHRRFDEFEQSLTAYRLDQMIRAIKWKEVDVSFPRFKITSDFTLRKTLEAMGIIDAFAPDIADFSGMTESKDQLDRLFISEGYHKAFVETNEEGTEAGAATGVLMKMMGERNPSAVFRADHPFVFIILHRPTKCILFMGRVTRP
jgi:serpin B